MNDSYEDMVRTDNRIVLFLGMLFAVFMLSMVFVSAIETKGGVYNGGFEYGTGSQGTSAGWVGDKDYGWYAIDAAGNNWSWEFDTTEKHSGNQSIKLTITDASSRSVINCVTTTGSTVALNLLSNCPKIKPSTNYKLSLWYKGTDLNFASGTIILGQIHNSTGARLGNYGNIYGTNGTTDWKYAEASFTSPSTSEYIIINPGMAQVSSAQTLWIDDIRLEEVDTLSLSTQQSGRPSLTITGVTDTEAIDQSQTTSNSGSGGFAGNVSNIISRAQSFKPTQSKFTGVTLYKSSTVGTPTGNLIIELRTDNSNKPSTTVLASKTYTLSEWNALSTGDNFIPLPAILTPGTLYWIVGRDSASETNGNYYESRVWVSGNVYSDGNAAYTTDGTNWTIQTNIDFYFKTHFAKLSSSVDLNVVAPDGTSELKSYDVNGDILTDANITINPDGTGRYYYAPTTLVGVAGRTRYFADIYDWNYNSGMTTPPSQYTSNGLIAYSPSIFSYTWKFKAPVGCTFDGNALIGGYAQITTGRWAYLEHSFNNSTFLLDINMTTNGSQTLTPFSVDGNNEVYLRYRNGSNAVYLNTLIFDANLSCPGLTTPLFKSGTNTLYTMNKDADNQNGATLTPSLMSNLNFSFTAPTTTFTSFQVPNTTDQNITLTCTDNNTGCKYINYKINYGSWNQKVYSDANRIFTYNGVGYHTIQYFSTDNSGNTETTKTSNFTTYGNGRFYFKDENSGSDLTGVQVNFNGVDYNSGANNYLDFNFQTFSGTNTTYLFTITKTGYSTRYYQTDLNYFSEFDTNFALLPESLATDLQFKMFPPTGTTTLANTYIEFKDKDTNYTITRLKSNENGELTANLRSDDQNYLVWISEGTYIYQAVQLTILYPKDEQTLNNITGNWRIEITDNISYQDLNIPQGTNKIIYLLPNTKYPFTIAVQDVAGTYFKRKWSKIYQGNPLTDTLQPYLVNADDGIAVKFVFQDPKRDSIENIIINIYKNVGGIKTLISSGASDVTGNALFFLIAGDKYTLDFSYDGTIIFETQNYTVTSSTVYWTINLATREIKTVDGTFITIGFNPIQDYILKNATNISYKVTASGLNKTQAEFYIIQDGNKIITYTRDAPCTTPCTVTIPIEDLNITLGNKVYLDLNVYIDSNNYIFNYKKTWSYGTTSNIDTHDLFVKARIDFGCTTDTMWPCPLTSIVSIIIMILLIGSMVFTFNFVNPKGLLVAGLGILAVFTYLGWFWWVALVLIIIASIFYLRGD